MNIQLVKISKSNYSLLLVILIFICSSPSLFSQTKDTLWTRDVWPLTLINGVFSPDDQFIYATCLQNNTDYLVRKYNSNGDLISEIDTIGGIRQFSEDGRFFWNYYGDKYDALNNQRISRVVDKLGRTNINFGASVINEKTDIGIIYDGGNVVKTEDYQYIPQFSIISSLRHEYYLRYFISRWNL
ncbi:MAG: hypothetical protein A2X64_05555 [Ignavibacteria bacterium GWF2_33_9]|nr:MAG: hypothetical protein A2X64_05555 [Ignavibacteria bacterium GWF2_33_9]